MTTSKVDQELRDLEKFLQKLGIPKGVYTCRKNAKGERKSILLTLAERVRLCILRAVDSEDPTVAAEMLGLEEFPDVPHPVPE